MASALRGLEQSNSKAEPEDMSLLGLVRDFQQIHDGMADRQFAFILGAGASKASNIKTAAEMVSDWVEDLRIRSGTHLDCEAWATAANLRISAFDPSEPAAAYAELYDRMYRKDPGRGYGYLESQMSDAEPSYGYSVLARILETTRHRVVITTNFDNLVADSLAIFSRTYPLICGHESLTPFVRAEPKRPLVVKLHRDLLLAPKSSPAELNALPEAYKEALGALLRRFTPIVVGYGGNDGSLMGYLEGLPPDFLQGGLYWCYWQGGSRPNEAIRRLVARQNGYLVPVPGFDELMLLFGEVLRFDVPDKFVRQRAAERADRIVQQFTALRGRIEFRAAHRSVPTPTSNGPSSVDVAPALLHAANETTKRRLIEWENLAARQTLPAERANIFEKALQDLPDSTALILSYARFLRDSHWNGDRAEELFEQAIQLRPSDVSVALEFADFLDEVRKDSRRANEIRTSAKHGPESASRPVPAVETSGNPSSLDEAFGDKDEATGKRGELANRRSELRS